MQANSLKRIPWLAHAFSTRKGGRSRVYGGNALNLGFTPQDSPKAVEDNREILRSLLAHRKKTESWALVTLRQIHSDLIHVISKPPGEPIAGDGLISNVPGLLLAVLAADCLPLILADPKRRVIGVVHAGWRGTLQRIAEKAVGEMRKHFGSQPGDLKAAIGPGIRGCCYQVGPELRDTFRAQFPYADELFRSIQRSDEIGEKYPLLFLSARPPGHSQLPETIHLDLPQANRRQLLAAGVAAAKICDLGQCTCCRRDLFFSHRGDRGVTGRMMAVVGLRE
ncbi:MAG: peptidoglycan editing factor PgeF [Acidobacteria bacterium]|nr:peptidoglycan editing factor PgeF [Acidobacteriota bacterium]